MNTDALPRAYGSPVASGRFPAAAEDFQVDEVLGFEPDGAGQHALIRVRKQNCNTEWVARQLATLAGVRHADVGYAGLKDRHAVTSQWFSVDLAGRSEPDWWQLETPGLRVLHVARHRRKLRRGTLSGNRFVLRVRDLRTDRAELEERLVRIRGEGVPNYFGQQRFGSDNLKNAAAMFTGSLKVRDRHRRGLYLSAARSMLFNHVLARRVAAGTWNRALHGDAMQLDGSNSFFVVETIDDTISRRTGLLDIHPTGPLWGRGTLPVTGEVRDMESLAMRDYPSWCTGLELAGCEQQRRALRVCVPELEWECASGGILELRFSLTPGSYATMCLREAIDVVALRRANSYRPECAGPVAGDVIHENLTPPGGSIHDGWR